MSRGAPKAPVTYEGDHDPDRTYLPLRIVKHGGGAFLSVATNTGVTPDPASQTPWLPLSAGGPIWLEAIVTAGPASVASNLMPPGFRVPAATTLRAVYVNVGTAPTGSALTVLLKRSGTTVATVNVPAGSTAGSDTGLSLTLAAGDLLTTDISAIGSTVAGSDVLVTVEAY